MTRQRKSSNAPGQALGFSLQFTRLTHLLLTMPQGSFVSFEVFDDVAGETPDGQKQFIQSKSALTANPLTDRSVAFWKTLANWADTLASGNPLAEKLRLILYVSRPADGPIARSFAEATTNDTATSALAKARKEVFEVSRAKPQHEIAKELKPHLERFFQAKPEIAVAVIRAFEIECGSGSPQADLEKEIAARFVPEARVRMVTDHACGWAKRRVDELLEQSKAAILARDEFHQEMTLLVRKYTERAILHSFAPAPTREQTEALLPKLFVQQLQLVELGFDEQLEAISQFFRAVWDRTKWGETGEVHRTSLDQLDESLVASWKNLKKITSITSSQQPDVQKGQLLLAQCMEHKANVEHLQPPAHFIPGCFHLLADALKVGWHPNYQHELQQRVEKGVKR
jgi:hypothetical protein